MQGFTSDIVVIDFHALYHYATAAIIPIPNLYYICTLTYLGNVFMFYPTCYICPGLIFQYKFNGGVYFGIGLTKKGNLLVLYVFHTVFQYEFNYNGDCVIQWLFLGTIFQNEFNGGGYTQHITGDKFGALYDMGIIYYHHFLLYNMGIIWKHFSFACTCDRVATRYNQIANV
jgi:hypothetical protein